MHTRNILIAALLLFCVPSVLGSDVVELTSKNFDSIVFKSKVPVLLEFYAPWCGHCKNLVPVYEQVATNLKGVAIVAKIDATVEEGLAHRYAIRGFPTLKLYKPGVKDLQDYQGARSAQALVSFVTSALTSNGILRLKSSLDSIWEKKPISVPRVILFSSKAEPSTLYKSLSMRYADQLVFAQVQQNDILCSSYSIETFPSLLVLPSVDTDPVKFEGKFGPEALTEFLAQFASDEPTMPVGGSDKSKPSSASTSPTTPTRPKASAAQWKSANDWDTTSEQCGKNWCILLLNRESQEIDDLKARVLALYGKDGKFQFVEVKETDNNGVGSKFVVADTESQWVVYNAKKSKFAKTAFDGSVPAVLLDRVVSGDAKLIPLQ